MIHRANADFWNHYRRLPEETGPINNSPLNENPQHPSLQFKKLGDRSGQEIWSVRVTLKYRAFAVKMTTEYL